MSNILMGRSGAVGTLTINRPEKLNTLSLDTLVELRARVEEMLEDDEVSAVVITGVGEKAFVAGADLKEMAMFDSYKAKAFAELGQETFDLIENGGKPFIAAINGYALGGGCELGLACSIRIAAECAVFGQPEIKLGIITGWGGSHRLVRLLGRSRALELCLLGEHLNASKAMQWGLVSRVVPTSQLIPEAMSIANTVASYSSTAVKYTLEAIHRASEAAPAEGLRHEAALFALCFANNDTKARMLAFLSRKSRAR